MIQGILKGKVADAWLWTPIEGVESVALDQIRTMSTLPWLHHHIAIMPDVHWGNGATVGSVIAMKDAVAPAAVGVDIGCVDKDTEYLSPTGWKYISEYNNESILQYNPSTKEAYFAAPLQYIKQRGSWFYHIKTKYGVDQMLSPDHKVLYAPYTRDYKFDKYDTILAKNLVDNHESTTLGFRGRFLTTFNYKTSSQIDLTNQQLRIMVMIIADGSYVSTSRVHLRLKKERKIERAYQLLTEANIAYETSLDKDNVTTIKFYAPYIAKDYEWAWSASTDQLKIIAEESFHWDGNIKDHVFFTRNIKSANFMQFAYSVAGYRSVLRSDIKNGELDYRVFANPNTVVGINGTPKSAIEKVASEDGYEYCFTTQTGFWIMRRNGNVVITGNCGMGAIKLNLKANDLPNNLKELRARIENAIPVGFASRESVDKEAAQYSLWSEFGNLDSRVHKLKEKAKLQCGTLGGGNHFIEICLDTEDNVWFVLHSGSRNIGKELAEIHINIAKTLEHNQKLQDRNLAVFLKETPEYMKYVHDLKWAQNYAYVNREVMMNNILRVIQRYFDEYNKNVQPLGNKILCHHNYVSEEFHYGEDVLITRKGAISAAKGELGIIPGSMGTKSYIVEGLGNPESFNSASHGAGRRMSRGAAKKKFTIEDLIEQTSGVECRKDKAVIDEIPGAYKNIDEVINYQNDLVKVKAELKQILCIKG